MLNINKLIIFIFIISIIKLSNRNTLVDILNRNETAITIWNVKYIHWLKVISGCSLPFSSNIYFILIRFIYFLLLNTYKFVLVNNHSSISVPFIDSSYFPFFCLHHHIIFIVINNISNNLLSLLLCTFSLMIYGNLLLNILILIFTLL